MAARPPGFDPIPETLDGDIDETAPPARSPLRPLPFGPPVPGHSAAFQKPNPPPQHPPTGEETVPAERSPLAAAMPFRHAKESAATMALPQLSPEDLRRMTGGSSPTQPTQPTQNDAAARARIERAKLENAKTVGFMMPPGMEGPPPVPQQPNAPPAPRSAYPPPAQGQGASPFPAVPQAPRTPSVYPPAAPGQPAHMGARPSSVYPPAQASPSVYPPAQPSPSAYPPHEGRSQSVYPPAVPSGGGPVAAKSTGRFGLSIEQYAALCAEVNVYPESAEAIFTQYGLASRKDRLTADAGWQERLRADPILMQRWQALYLHYHDYYSKLRRG
ncbi:MAG: hypothetical protein IPK82_39080 [Polyangiaceae bacterium]|nr:hypothetical protein [Polyangiaceae bacterium]